MLDRELEGYLRQFPPLSEVTVCYSSPEAQAIAPFLVVISGYVSLYGETHYYETDFDLRTLGSHKDLERLALVLMRSIEEAGEHVSTVH